MRDSKLLGKRKNPFQDRMSDVCMTGFNLLTSFLVQGFSCALNEWEVL